VNRRSLMRVASQAAASLIVALCGLIGPAAPPSHVAAEDTVVVFPDPILEQRIRLCIGQPTGEIHESALVGIVGLDVHDTGVANLEGLQYCSSLETLYLEMNRVDDIGPLAGIASLQSVSLGQNQISDISPLAGLTDIKHLLLDDNAVSDVNPLSGLTWLEVLSLSGNQIADISPVSNLACLWILTVENNQVNDISAVSGLHSLQSLSLGGNRIADISPLTDLGSLSCLGLENNEICDIAPLHGLDSMRNLYLSNNRIADISLLEEMLALERLTLSGNEISDVSALSRMDSLRVLELDDNLIFDIAPLSGLTNMWKLCANDNLISNLMPLSAMERLAHLCVSGNPIDDIRPLQGLSRLSCVDLSNTPVKDMTPLQGPNRLHQLYITNTQVEDLEPLVLNDYFALGKSVWLADTPLTTESMVVHIPTLVRRGVNLDIWPSQAPDLEPTSPSVAWETIGETYLIEYTIRNKGGMPHAESTTSVSVDGQEAIQTPCPALGPGESFSGMAGPYTVTGTEDTLSVCADIHDDVLERNEVNNCREKAVNYAADLTVSRLWLGWDSECDLYNVNCEIANWGDATSSPCLTSATIDGVEIALEDCPSLQPYKQHCFTLGPYAVTEDLDCVVVCADAHNSVVEVDEADNCKTKEAWLEANTVLAVANDQATVTLGETFDVTVSIDAEAEVSGAQLMFAFDPAVVQCTGAEEGTFFNDNVPAGATVLHMGFPLAVNNETGTVANLGSALLPYPPGITGTGSLAVYHFEAVGPGISPLSIADYAIADSSGEPMEAVHVLSDLVEVSSPAWDTNLDHVCDLSDILAVSGHWREYGLPGWIPADTKPDGEIDLFDIIAVGHHWNETW